MGLVRSIGRHWRRWAVLAVVAVAVVVVGGPFVYIHLIEGKAPAPLSLATSSPSTTAAGATTTPSVSTNGPVVVDGTWKVTTGSQAGYRIKETLFGQSNTAVGRTSALTGSITINGTTVTAGSFTADLTKITSDQSQRDDQFQGRIMDTANFPTATFTMVQPIQFTNLPVDGVQVTQTATGNLVLKGTSRSVTFSVTARRSGAAIQVSGSIPVTFANWNISNPSGGPATTEDHGTLEFLLTFAHA
jgi:polyisoprenoid-binding protein YceI